MISRPACATSPLSARLMLLVSLINSGIGTVVPQVGAIDQSHCLSLPMPLLDPSLRKHQPRAQFELRTLSLRTWGDLENWGIGEPLKIQRGINNIRAP